MMKITLPARRWLPVALPLLLLITPHPSQAQAPPNQLRLVDRMDQVIRATRKAPDELAAYQILMESYENPESKGVRSLIEQLVATQQSQLGNYRAAEALTFSNAGGPIRAFPADGSTLRAVDAISAMSQDRRVVMLNEAHSIARTRLLTLQLLKPLRERGFTHLALEALSASDDTLATRGYPVGNSGHYTKEPVFGELIRHALALGYTLVAYEYRGPDRSHQARETGQAEILANLLNQHPDARILVHAGHAHINKDSSRTPWGARSMAAELRRLSGINPLSIEQTIFWDQPEASRNHPFYAQAVSLWQAHHNDELPADPFMLVHQDGRAWALRPAAHDISIFAAPWTDEQHWRALDGLRQHRTLTSNPCTHYPCLIEARYMAESDEAIPADRQLLEQAGPVQLWLRDGCYRVRHLPNDTEANGAAQPVCFAVEAGAGPAIPSR